ncbi:MAG TPA: outer membrane beta-barrel protein [Acidobacteriaceae bacterium]|nr:outer membrane beta-barrel protein [Acidobacteriaceae bacterium]
MKRGWLVLLLVVGLAAPAVSHAQVAAYGEFSVSDLHNLVSQDFLLGATTGVLVDGPHIFRALLVSADIQGRFVRKSGESLNGVTVGPRFSLSPKFGGLAPYAEFMVGFARYNNPNNGGPTTDSTIQVNGGVTKRVSPRWDVAAEYSYSQYYALGGQYNPKTYSIGAVYHFTKR